MSGRPAQRPPHPTSTRGAEFVQGLTKLEEGTMYIGLGAVVVILVIILLVLLLR